MTSRFDRLEVLLFVAAGGFAGAISRHALGALSGSLPWGTLAANVAGAFVLGVVLSERHLADRLSVETRLLVGTGFCSSLTTYSTFAVETTHLAGRSAGGPAIAAVADALGPIDGALAGPVVALSYVAVTYALGFAAILSAQALTRGVIR
ncbi:MAG: CrcB family protein [Halococcoides sp.]